SASAGRDPGSAQPLAAARAAMRRAAEQLAPRQPQSQAGEGDPARAARPAMQEAARNLRAAVQQGAESGAAQAQAGAVVGAAGPPGVPGEPAGLDPRGTLIGSATPDLAALKATLERQTGRGWGELPGHLRTEILERAQGRYRDDYARLIQLYF